MPANRLAKQSNLAGQLQFRDDAVAVREGWLLYRNEFDSGIVETRESGRSMQYRDFFAITSLLLLSSCSPEIGPTKQASPSTNVNKLQLSNTTIADFASPQWPNVMAAEKTLEARPDLALPQLMELLERDELVKLRDTANLIYPGAETFYGHGRIINYGIDWLTVRAGWAIEEITFQDFGFSEHGIDHDDLLTAVIAGIRDVPLSDVARIDRDAKRSRDKRAQAINRAKAWWQSNHGKWTRLSSLVEALRSDNIHRVLSALHWLRFGESSIDGFDREFYVKEAFPIVQLLAKSPNEEISTQAGHLVEDFDTDEWWWLRQKVANDGQD